MYIISVLLLCDDNNLERCVFKMPVLIFIYNNNNNTKLYYSFS